MDFNNIRVVLVNTSHPGNIGAVARAMKTMCLNQLALVQPKSFPHTQADVRAAGAEAVLHDAIIYSSLSEALQDCQLIIGASARSRRISWPQLDPRQCATLVDKESHNSKIALVFGREHSGLSNIEMDACHYLVQIPSNVDFSSLNIASAVQVILYELYQESLKLNKEGKKLKYSQPLASLQEMEYFYQHLTEVLLEIEFIDSPPPKSLLRRIRRFFNRTNPNKVEVNILRGILTAIQENRVK